MTIEVTPQGGVGIAVGVALSVVLGVHPVEIGGAVGEAGDDLGVMMTHLPTHLNLKLQKTLTIEGETSTPRNEISPVGDRILSTLLLPIRRSHRPVTFLNQAILTILMPAILPHLMAVNPNSMSHSESLTVRPRKGVYEIVSFII